VPLPFTKMHGCGNDYVVLDAFETAIPDPDELARRLCDRRFGVGADGLLLGLPSGLADLRMRMFNPDGSEAEMCGNGLRCLVKFAWERRCVPRRERLVVETGAGLLPVEIEVEGETVVSVDVDMGIPRLEPEEIPMDAGPGRIVEHPLELDDRTLSVENLDEYPVENVGRRVERHAAFPRRTNVEFVQCVSPTEVRQRTWERGAGETLACGTGACAVAVAGVLTGRTERELLIRLRGGDLKVRWTPDDHVHLSGPAVEVFQGLLP
jgi:diaminopimelate epimerase